MALRSDDIPNIEEDLEELEHNITRLRLEYEQYFRGAMKREPFALKGKVQKIITQYLTKPPRSSAHKFRFNSLNARFQSLRNMWGRTMREIESGTYRPHKFLARAADAASQEAAMREASKAEREAEAAAEPPARTAAPAVAAPAQGSTLNRLHSALLSARQKTGESVADLTEEKLARLVRQQTQALRQKHGDSAKIKFKIVVEDNKAKLKATVS